jgi:ferredoxin-NADP reductase
MENKHPLSRATSSTGKGWGEGRQGFGLSNLRRSVKALASDSPAAPVPQRVTYEATIERIVERAPDTRSFFLRLPPTQPFTFKPGQFISCLLPIEAQTVIRPYSLASSPDEFELVGSSPAATGHSDPTGSARAGPTVRGPASLEICLNRVPGGAGSAYLFGLGIGATLRFTGPWGTFTLDQAPDAECVFIADGTGIAPIRPMLRRALASQSAHPLRLHYAAASQAHLLYADEFEGTARAHPRFTFFPVLAAPLAEAVERRYVGGDQDRSRHFYICGVGDIVPQLRDLLRRAGYERRAVQYEKW